MTLIRPNSVDTHSGGFTGTVLTLVNIHALVIGEDIARLAPAAGYMVCGRAGPSATTHYAACVNTPVVGHLAHLVAAAVGVLLALNLGAPEGGAGVPHVLVKTLAEWFVILHLAVSIFATLSPVTWVDTFPIATSIPGTG